MLTMRNISASIGVKDYSKARGALLFGVVVLSLGIIAALILFPLFGYFSAKFGAPGNIYEYLAGAALLITLMIADFNSNVLRSFGSVAIALAPRDLIWRILAPLVAVLMVYNNIYIDTRTALWINAVVLGGLVVIQFVYLFAKVGKEFGRIKGEYILEKKKWFYSSMNFWGILITSGITQHLMIVAVGFSLAPEDVGVFFVAYRTASLLSMPLNASELVMAPMIARHYAEGKLTELSKVFRLFSIMAIVPTFIGFIIFSIWGDWILKLINPSYANAGHLLTILAAGFFVNTMTGPCGYVMLMSKGEKTYLKISMTINIASVVLVGIVAFWGMIPSAFLLSIAIVAQNLIVAAWCRKNLNIETTVATLWTYKKSL